MPSIKGNAQKEKPDKTAFEEAQKEAAEEGAKKRVDRLNKEADAAPKAGKGPETQREKTIRSFTSLHGLEKGLIEAEKYFAKVKGSKKK